MKKTFFIFSFFLFFSAVFLSCTKPTKKSAEIPEIPGLVFEESIPLKYATQFQIHRYFASHFESSGSLVSGGDTGENKNPVFFLTVSGTDRYILLPKESVLPQNLPSNVAVIRTPVTNAYLCASSAMALWNRLGSLDSIRFSAIQKKDWYVPEAVRAMEEGKILYSGKYNAPDFELLLKENCQLTVESTMIYHAPQVKEKLESLGIPVFVDKSSYEENPLGRMEWIKLYGLMCGKLDAAEEFFEKQVAKIETNSASQKITPKSVSFFYMTSNGMVAVRGSEDYIVKMIEMAGGKYAFKNTRKSSSPSVTISMEQFYAQCASSDILIYNSSIDNTLKSKADLLSKSPLFADFKAVQDGEVWMTGKYLYQATDRIGDMILDLRKIVTGQTEQMSFLERVE